jgi:uncharacterized membrane protein
LGQNEPATTGDKMVTGAMLLALTCVAWLIFFIQHISQAISVNHIVDRIASETEDVIDDIMPDLQRYIYKPADVPFNGSEREVSVDNAVSGYIRYVDTGRLLYFAKAFKLRVRMLRRVGHFVPAGVALFCVSPEERLDPERAGELRSAFDIGPTRTMQQDVEFGVIQIIDIALKAISPAVNDPSTAISCVDQLGRILIRFVGRKPAVSLLCDPPHVVRVIVPWIGIEGLLDTAFEQIRHYSTSDIAVSLRLLRALDDIASTGHDAGIIEPLVVRGRRIVAGCAERLSPDQIEKLRQRLSALEARMDPFRTANIGEAAPQTDKTCSVPRACHRFSSGNRGLSPINLTPASHQARESSLTKDEQQSVNVKLLLPTRLSPPNSKLLNKS